MSVRQSNKDELITFNPSVLYWFIGSKAKQFRIDFNIPLLTFKANLESFTYHHIQVFYVHPTHCPIPLLPSTKMDSQTRPELEEDPTRDHAQDTAMARLQAPKRFPPCVFYSSSKKKKTLFFFYLCKIITGPYCLCPPPLRVCRNGTDSPQQLVPALGAPFPADIQNTEPLLSLNVVS